MKKLTLLLVAAALLSGGAFAQEKSCCKKGGHCTKACAKDKKSDSKEAKATNMNKSGAVVKEAPKKTS